MAEAEFRVETEGGGTLTFYGQLSPAITVVDDGVSRSTQLGDNAASVSRIGFLLRQPVGENSLRLRFETAIGFGATDEFSQTGGPFELEWNRERLRHLDLEYRTEWFGTFFIGQGSMASDGLGDLDASGTGLAGSLSIPDVAGNFEFRDAGGALSGVEIGDAFANFDGSRRGRIRYDTPQVARLTFGLAYGRNILDSGNDDHFYDAGLSYETELSNGVEIEAGLGVQLRERTGRRDRRDRFASVTAEFPSGWSVNLAIGDRNTGGQYGYAKLAYTAEFLAVGETSASIDLYSGRDMDSKGDRAASLGIGVVQDFDDLNIQAYAGYRRYAYSDTSATRYRDIESYVLGLRWRF